MTMRVTVGQLRSLIREEVSKKTSTKAFQLVKQALESANSYLRAVSMRSDSPGKHAKAVQESAEQLSVLAQWMIKNREPDGDKIGRVAAVALELSKQVGFWQRPAFVGRDSYIQNVEELVQKLKRYAVDVRNSSRVRAA
jgi:hypothetical protein